MVFQDILFICSSAIIIAVSIIDIRNMIIPDLIVFPSILIMFLLKLFFTPDSWLHLFILLCLGFMPFFLIHFCTSGKMGMGDAKFSAFLALLLDVEGWLLMVLFSSTIAIIFAFTGVLIKKLDKKNPIPFGPFLGIGSFLSFLLLSGNVI